MPATLDERTGTTLDGGLALVLAVLALTVGCMAGASPPAEPVGEPAPTTHVPFWPPVVGQEYPDLQLADSTGRTVRLSELKGRVVLLEPIGMSCPACQAFAGAHEAGSFRGVRPQQGLDSIDASIRTHAGIDPDDPRLVHVQLLLYDMSARAAPTLDDARDWAAHFESRGDNRIVLVGSAELVGPDSYEMIPGFQLIDRDLVLRVDSTGHRPRHNLWRELLPELGRLVRAAPMPAAAAASPSVTEGHAPGQRLPEFELDDLGGERRSFAALRAGRPAFLYVYSGCCGHCSDRLPQVVAAARGYRERGAAIVGVEYLGNATSCDRNRRQHDLPGTILADADGGVCGRLGVGDFTVFLLDADGVVRYRGSIEGVPRLDES